MKISFDKKARVVILTNMISRHASDMVQVAFQLNAKTTWMKPGLGATVQLGNDKDVETFVKAMILSAETYPVKDPSLTYF